MNVVSVILCALLLGANVHHAHTLKLHICAVRLGVCACAWR